MNPTKTIARMTSDIPPKKKRSVRRATGAAGRLTAMGRLRLFMLGAAVERRRSCAHRCSVQGRMAAMDSALGGLSPQLERANDPIQLCLNVGALGAAHREGDDLRFRERDHYRRALRLRGAVAVGGAIEPECLPRPWHLDR